jgi:drug/metabolite transporter (DMT)-like permease
VSEAQVGIAAAAIAAGGFGVADFLGGSAARRSSAIPVAARVQAIGALVLLVTAMVAHAPITAAAILLGTIGGLFSASGLALLYRALTRGGMGMTIGLGSVVLSLTTLLADVILRGDVPSPLQVGGVACAIAATWLASARPGESGGIGSIALVVLAGMGFGIALVFLDRAAETSPLWGLAAARAAGTVLLLGLVGRGWPALRQQWPPTVGAGLLDAGASALFVGSFVLLPVGLSAAVSAAATPLVPMALAWFILHERVSGSGTIAVALACIGIALIALG